MGPSMRLWLIFLLIGAATMLSAVAPRAAMAAPADAVPASGLEGIGRTVDDEELSDMRGKFVSADRISYFGVQMQTSWQGPDGVTTSATLSFSVDFLGGAGNPDGATPVLMIGWNREGDPSLDVAGFGEAAADGYVALPVGGLESTYGAVQSQLIAGSDNAVRNAMRIAVVPASAVQRPDGEGLTTVTDGQSLQFADGDTLQFLLGDNQLGIALASGGDQVRQSMNGMLGQAAQHVLLSSSSNSIHNGMNVVIGYDQLEQNARVSMDNALSAIKGIGF